MSHLRVGLCVAVVFALALLCEAVCPPSPLELVNEYTNGDFDSLAVAGFYEGDVGKELRKKPDTNTCAIRFSHSLLRNGCDPKTFPGKKAHKWKGKKDPSDPKKAVVDHSIRAADMVAWAKKQYTCTTLWKKKKVSQNCKLDPTTLTAPAGCDPAYTAAIDAFKKQMDDPVFKIIYFLSPATDNHIDVSVGGGVCIHHNEKCFTKAKSLPGVHGMFGPFDEFGFCVK